jgi:hypothetical protein
MNLKKAVRSNKASGSGRIWGGANTFFIPLYIVRRLLRTYYWILRSKSCWASQHKSAALIYLGLDVRGYKVRSRARNVTLFTVPRNMYWHPPYPNATRALTAFPI